MTTPCQSIDSLFQHLISSLNDADLAIKPTKPMLKSIAALSYAIVAAKDVQLPQIALKIPWETKTVNLIQRMERLLKNPRFDEHQMFAPLARNILRQLSATTPSASTICLVLDQTDINDRHYLLAVSLVFKGRTIPLTWQVRPGQGASSYVEQEAILERVLAWIPEGADVILLADREFATVALMDFCLTEGWHFCFRIKGNRRLTRADGTPFQPKSVPLAFGARRFINKVTLPNLKGETLSLSCGFEGKEIWYILSNLPAGARVLHYYACRFTTEETFRDWKSYGFRLENTHIVVAERVSRLLFCVCLAHLWCLWWGVSALRRGLRRELESRSERCLSILQLGLRLLTRYITLGKRLPIQTLVRLN